MLRTIFDHHPVTLELILSFVTQICSCSVNNFCVFIHDGSGISISGQLRMAQGYTCMACVRRHSKLITACACVNQLYVKGCINCDYITLALELPRKRADWMHSKLMLFIDF